MLARVLPMMLSAPEPPVTSSMNGPLAVSQVTLFVPSVSVPVARLMVTPLVTEPSPQAIASPGAVILSLGSIHPWRTRRITRIAYFSLGVDQRRPDRSYRGAMFTWPDVRRLARHSRGSGVSHVRI